MKKLLLPVILIVVLIGAYVVFNTRPETPDDQTETPDEPTETSSTGGDPPTSGDETPEEPDEPTLERGLKGVSLSARNYTGEGLLDFFGKAPESNDLIIWVGDWAQLGDPESAPFLVYNMMALYDYEAMTISAYIDQGSGTILRPLDEETKQMYLESASSFASTYKPRYMGFGVEMNVVKKTNPEAYDEFK